MRRQEFEVTDPGEILGFLDAQHTGVLTFGNDGEGEYPYSVPVNYARNGNDIIFHSASSGKKGNLLRNGTPVQFTVYREFSLIPSYFQGTDAPCFASQFFKSAMVFGRLQTVVSAAEKAAFLGMLMRKMQPEGGYAAIDTAARALTSVMIGRICTEGMSAKFKFGQQLDAEPFRMILEQLRKRGEPIDIETADCMIKYRSTSQ